MSSLAIIIGVVAVIVILMLLFKYKEIRHKIGLVIVAGLFIFLVISVVHVYTNSKGVDLTTFDGVLSAGKLYFSWLGGIVGNVVKVSGYAVKQDWSLDSLNQTVNASKLK